jgi:hypothetical protein
MTPFMLIVWDNVLHQWAVCYRRFRRACGSHLPENLSLFDVYQL